MNSVQNVAGDGGSQALSDGGSFMASVSLLCGQIIQCGPKWAMDICSSKTRFLSSIRACFYFLP